MYNKKEIQQEGITLLPGVDLSDGHFSERCDVDGSFFNSNAIPIFAKHTFSLLC